MREKLYEITEQILRVDELLDKVIDVESGEITDEDAFNEYIELQETLKNMFDTKTEDIVKFMRSLESGIVVRKSEIDRLKKLNDRGKNKIARLKEYLLNNMISSGKTRVDTSLGAIGTRKSQKVIVNEDIIPKDERYWRVETTHKFDKNEIKKILKSGEQIDGVSVEDSVSINIR